MSDHLSPALLNALVDGELPADQLATINDHLADCPACTSQALQQILLKRATARAGQRYTPPAHVRDRLAALASQAAPQTPIHPSDVKARPGRRFAGLGWATAAVLLLLAASLLLLQRGAHRADLAASQQSALFHEAFDQHLATLAGNMPPQVLSTDRHTVKPWFQGKLPFSFNLPENLPSDITLNGANLAYLHNQPVAQLLYSIGKHRVSVFIEQNSGATGKSDTQTDLAGFRLIDGSAGDLTLVAVSDVDPVRLAGLADALKQAQSKAEKPSD